MALRSVRPHYTAYRVSAVQPNATTVSLPWRKSAGKNRRRGERKNRPSLMLSLVKNGENATQIKYIAWALAASTVPSAQRYEGL